MENTEEEVPKTASTQSANAPVTGNITDMPENASRVPAISVTQQEVIDLGAGDRETALRWMLQGDMGDDKELDLYAVEYFTMMRGIDSTETGRNVEKELITIANENSAFFGIAA